MIPWRYKVTWADGRTEEVTISLGDKARFEARMGHPLRALIDDNSPVKWTDYSDLLIVHMALTRLKVEPVQSFDEFLDTVADLDQLQFGEPAGKAPGRAAPSGRSRRSPSSGDKTR